MIKNIRLRFGVAPGLENIQFDLSPITVFVGPNNSGKSKVLSEIERYCKNGNRVENDLILDELMFEGFTTDLALQNVEHFTLPPFKNESLNEGHIIVGKYGNRTQVPKETLLQALQNPNQQSYQYCAWFLSYNTLILNGKNRINLVNDQQGSDLKKPSHSSFQALFQDDGKRAEVRRIVYEAFNSYFVIDATDLGKLCLRLSKREPKSHIEERGIHKEAVQFQSEALHIEHASDGVKAFTGMITEIIAGDPRVLLIDEPEAFLHPSLSYKLGKEIAQASKDTDKRIFVSTHSPNFVMGCIQSGAPVNIVRLTYRDEVATARVLPNDDILRLMRNPLLRSTGVLDGLFYEYVVVTESDTDRAFYQEINDRLLALKPDWGVTNCLFINAQNKQTVRTILKPLRELGIPTAGIVDIDVIKEGGSVWTNFLKSGYLPEISYESLSDLRNAVKQKFNDSGLNMKRDGGVEILQERDREAANNLFDQLENYGLFIVRKGELESWLPQLNASGHGPAWLIEVFEKMGEDPDCMNYLKPQDDDVWEFLFKIKNWFINPKKKGIPE